MPFNVIWIATTLSLTGIAMSDTASAWLMTNLNADPAAVSMVQVASSLPMFLFTLAAGALADIVEARRFLIAVESFITALIVVFATMVAMKWETPTTLLATTFLLSASWSLAAPAWLAITPMLVPREDLDSANAANNVGYNLSRAVGPAIAGVIIAVSGGRDTVLDLRRRQPRRRGGAGVVAGAARFVDQPADRTLHQRDPGRPAPRRLQQTLTGDADPDGRGLSVRRGLHGRCCRWSRAVR